MTKRHRATTPCRSIVAPMTVCGAMPADPIHGSGPPLSNGHRRHTYDWPPVVLVMPGKPDYDVNGPTPWDVT